MKDRADIGIIGLAVMGENLALNMEGRGFTVAVHNRTVPGVEEGVVERFMAGRGKGRRTSSASRRSRASSGPWPRRARS